MANMSKNIDLFQEEGYDSWRENYWKKKTKNKDEVQKTAEEVNSSVDTVLKERNYPKESEDFFKGQLDITKDVLPKETMADRARLDLFDQQHHRKDDFTKEQNDKMLPTVQDAFMKIYPLGKDEPQSAAQNPTSSVSDEHKNGDRGDEAFPQNRIGTLMLDVKGNKTEWIGDHYLPKQCQDNKDKFTPPNRQLSSAWDAQKFDDGGFQPASVQKKDKCEGLSINLGELIEKALNKNNMKTEIDLSSSIANSKEKQVLNKPFKTPNGKASFAVYTKNDKEEVVRVDFNACKASDPNNIGPVWYAAYWGAKVDSEKAAEAKEQSLDQLSDFYTEKVLDPKKDLDWDGKTFYRHEDLLKKAPKLVNSKPSYEDETPMNKTHNVPSSTPANPERAKEEAAIQK